MEFITSKTELTHCICPKQPQVRSSFSSLHQPVSMFVTGKEQTQQWCFTTFVCHSQMQCKHQPFFLFGVVGGGGEEAFYLTYHLVSFLFSLDEPLNSNTNTSSEDHRRTTRPVNLGCRGTTALPLPATGWPGQSVCSLTIVSAEGYLLSRWHIFLIHFGSKARTWILAKGSSHYISEKQETGCEKSWREI